MIASPPPRRLAAALRALAMDAVQRAKSGHPGMPMGMADVAVSLFSGFLKFSAAHPDWPDRDRFVLSAGHGSMLQYALLHLCGYEDFPMAQLKSFRQLHSRAAGHPETGAGRGIETTTGPLGQGLGNAVGMAIGEQLLRQQWGEEVCDHRTWALAGDGCLMEGVSHEAASLAGHLQLSKLIVLFDDNQVSIDGPTSLSQSDDTLARFAAYRWHTVACDGHDAEDIAAAIGRAIAADQPSLIACRTVIGFGAPNKQGAAAAHGAPLGEEEVAAARQLLDWNHPPFEIPDDIAAAWREIGRRGETEYRAWRRRLQARADKTEIESRVRGELPPQWDDALQQWRLEIQKTAPAMATRKASGEVLSRLTAAVPALIGGSADLTPSNNTHVGQTPLSKNRRDGGYIHYGVREHAMAAAMNGLALHGGFIPYGGTFLVFSDYCRPAIRLSALMGVRTIYVMTHDSIGLGEDGPTHQPIEHLAALQAIPNLRVWRPCDALETAECWRLSLLRQDGPSLLALSRQSLPMLSDNSDAAAGCARGGYCLATDDNSDNSDSARQNAAPKRDITLAASGSEVALAVQTQKKLAAEGIVAAVVSMPCLPLFLRQDEDYRQLVLPPDAPLLAVEAATATTWQAAARQVCRADFQCMECFGASAPGPDVFNYFGFSADNLAAKARRLLGD